MHRTPLSAEDRAVAFALMTEAPATRLRLPDAQQTKTERHAATLLRLLALIGEVRVEDDDIAIAQALAAVDDAEPARIDAALTAIELPRWRRPLDRCAETLAYARVWGGGADEHSALFFARDPAVTARVAAFARERWPEYWRRHGCW